MKNNIMELTISSNAFEDVRADFDAVLKKTLTNMQTKDSSEAALTLKLTIKLDKEEVRDMDSDDPTTLRKMYKPSFDHKVSSVLQIKTEVTGSFNGDYELVWDEDLSDYVMKPMYDAQNSMFDEDYVNAVAQETTEQNMLPEQATEFDYDDFDEDFEEDFSDLE